MTTHGGRRKGQGRKPIADKTHITTFRLDERLWNLLPKPRAEALRQVVYELYKGQLGGMSRQAIDTEEVRNAIYARDRWRCQYCGRPIRREGGQPQLAHRIPQTKIYLALYGPEVIHHPLNLAAVCCLRCNDALNIGHDPEAVRALVDRIREELV